jgi:hypothetical protein
MQQLKMSHYSIAARFEKNTCHRPTFLSSVSAFLYPEYFIVFAVVTAKLKTCFPDVSALD